MSMAAEIRAVLEAAGSSDQAAMAQAEEWMREARDSSIQDYMAALADEMADQSAPINVRKMAGIQLKNEIYSKDEGVMREKQNDWCEYSQEFRDHVKEQAIGTLGTEGRPPSTAAQVIAFVACAELPQQKWPDAIPSLLAGLDQLPDGSEAPEFQRASVLEAIGYICEDVGPEYLESESNEILTAVIHSMRPEESSNVVVKCATTALTNALAFCEKNFQAEAERNAIMTSMCQVTTNGDPEIRVAALQCINETMNQYYGLMPDYMEALLEISGAAMVSNQEMEPNVVLQGIEFWNTVCDIEDRLIEQLKELGIPNLHDAQTELLRDDPGAPVCHFFASNACKDVLPVLLGLLITPEDEDDPDQWAPPKAACVCLDAMSLVCKREMLDTVIRFVEGHVDNDAQGGSWQKRDAALLAFASLLTPEDDEEMIAKIQELVSNVLGVVCPMIEDSSAAVRDTTAYVLGKCVESAPDVVFHDEYFPHVAEAIVAGLGDSEPRVATNACWGIFMLAQQAAVLANGSPSYHLSEDFMKLCQNLLQTADRPDSNLANLRPSAYDALSELIKSAPSDCFPVLIEVATELLHRLQVLLQQAASGGLTGDEVRQLTEQQSSLLVCVGELVRVLKKDNIMGAAADIMEVILAVLEQSTSAGLSAAKEDALTALIAMVEELGPDFMEYAEPFNQYIVDTLSNSAEYHACAVTVGLVGDICRCVGPGVGRFADIYMRGLGAAIEDRELDRSVKPQILSCIGDVAMALGENFMSYFEHSYFILFGAAQMARVDMSEEEDEDEIDYTNDLREGCLEGFTGIIVGMKGEGEPDGEVVKTIMAKVPDIVRFITEIFKDRNLTDDNIRNSLGLVGDLVDIFGADMCTILTPEFMHEICKEGLRSSNLKTTEIATWTKTKLEAITQTTIDS